MTTPITPTGPTTPSAPVVATPSVETPATVPATPNAKSPPKTLGKAAPPNPAPATAKSEGDPTEGQEAPKPEDPKLGARFAELARREKKLHEQSRAFKETEAKVRQYEERVAKAKEAPLDILESLGLSVSDIVMARVGKLPAEPETPDQRIEKLEKTLAERDRLAQEREQAAAEAADKAKLDGHAKQLTGYLNQHLAAANVDDKYELIASMGSEGIEHVFNVLVQHHAETGKPLPYEEAFDAVENYLLDEIKQAPLAKSKKLKAYLAELESQAAAKPEPVKPAKLVAKPASKSLSNTSKSGVVPVKAERVAETQKEKIARIADRLAEQARERETAMRARADARRK